MINKQALDTLAKIFQNASPLYLVGGATRSLFLNAPFDDLDICSALTPDEIKQLLKNSPFKIDDASAKFGTLIITSSLDKSFKAEHTTFRTDSYLGDGNHEPSAINFCNDIKTDASRRDFSVNALYMDLLTNEVFDFYNGLKDLRHKILRTIKAPDITFGEDALRILRLVRFRLKLNFKIEHKTKLVAKKLAPSISKLSLERIKSELNKILFFDIPLITDNKVSPKTKNKKAIKLLNELNISRVLFGQNILVKNYPTFIDLIFENSTTNSSIMSLFVKNNAEEKFAKTALQLTDIVSKTKNLADIKSKLVKNNAVLDIAFRLQKDNRKKDYIKKLQNEIISCNLPTNINSLDITGLEISNLLNISGKDIGEKLDQVFNEIITENIKNNKAEIICHLKKEQQHDN